MRGALGVLKRRALPALAALVVLVVLVVVGFVVWSLGNAMGFQAAFDAIGSAETVMRVVRPLLLVALVLALKPIVRTLVNVGVMRPIVGARLINDRPVLFVWLVVIEVAIGQAQPLIGPLILGAWMLARRLNTPRQD